MKNLVSFSVGLVEIDSIEMKEIDGGYIILGPLNLGNLAREGIGTLAGWGADFVNGFRDGFADGAR